MFALYCPLDAHPSPSENTRVFVKTFRKIAHKITYCLFENPTKIHGGDVNEWMAVSPISVNEESFEKGAESDLFHVRWFVQKNHPMIVRIIVLKSCRLGWAFDRTSHGWWPVNDVRRRRRGGVDAASRRGVAADNGLSVSGHGKPDRQKGFWIKASKASPTHIIVKK